MNLHVSAKGLAVLSALLSFAAPAMAADATLGVSAEVTKNCRSMPRLVLLSMALVRSR